MNTVTKEEYWSIILNDPTQIGQITTEDTEFNRRINDVNLVLSNTFINSSDENLISKWETSLYIDETEGKTITERKAEILYTLCEKNYVPVSIIKRFLLNLIGDENKFVVEFIKDENKLVIHTDRISDDMNEAVTSLLESVQPQDIEVVKYNHNMEISWQDINKYAECITYDDVLAVNPNYMYDVPSDGTWYYPFPKLKNAGKEWLKGLFSGYSPSYVDSPLRKIELYLPECTDADFLLFENKTIKEASLHLPKITIVTGLLGGSSITKAKLHLPNVSTIALGTNGNPLSSLTDLEVYWPKLSNHHNNFLHRTKLNKKSAINVLDSLPTWTSGTHNATIGIHIDHQQDEEVLAAIANAEAKGWTLTVQWNGTPTSAASTMAMGSLIYAKVGEYELPDGTTEQVLDWGHYVTDETGYETFRSLESAYKYFNLEQPTEF